MSKVPYSLAVGSLMYAMVCTRPDIAHAVGVVSRYMKNLGKEHWEEIMCILKVLLLMHYVLEVHTLFYMDMLIQIWQVIKIIGGAPQGMCLL